MSRLKRRTQRIRRAVAALPETAVERLKDAPLAPEESEPWPVRMFLLLVAVALLSRFAFLGAKDLWFDETRTLVDIWHPRAAGDTHALFFRIAGIFASLSSDETTAARIYPALCGALTIPVFFLFLRRIGGLAAAWMGVVLLLPHAFHLQYSQEARYYAPMMLFSAAVLWLSAELTHARRWMVLVVLAAIAGLHVLAWTHHPASLAMAGIWCAWFGAALVFTKWGDALLCRTVWRWERIPKRRIVLLAATAVVGMVLYKFLFLRIRGTILPLFQSQGSRTPGVEPTVRFASEHLWSFGWMSGFPEPMYIGFAGFATLVLGTAGAILLWRKNRVMAELLLLLLGGTAVAVFSVKYQKTYLVKYSAFLLPAVLTFCAVAAAELAANWKHRHARWIVTAVLLAGAMPGLVHYAMTDKMAWRAPMAEVARRSPEGAVLACFGHVGYSAGLYAADIPEGVRIEYLPWMWRMGLVEAQQLRSLARSSATPVYFVNAWPHDMPPLLVRFLEEEGELLRTWRSVDGEVYDSKLWHIRPQQPAWSSLERNAADFDGISIQSDAEIRIPQSERVLWLPRSATVEYRVQVEEARPVRLILTLLEPRAPGEMLLVEGFADGAALATRRRDNGPLELSAAGILAAGETVLRVTPLELPGSMPTETITMVMVQMDPATAAEVSVLRKRVPRIESETPQELITALQTSWDKWPELRDLVYVRDPSTGRRTIASSWIVPPDDLGLLRATITQLQIVHVDRAFNENARLITFHRDRQLVLRSNREWDPMLQRIPGYGITAQAATLGGNSYSPNRDREFVLSAVPQESNRESAMEWRSITIAPPVIRNYRVRMTPP